MNKYSFFFSAICFAIVLCSYTTASAQEVYGGFKAGINFASIDGPSLLDADGNELEEFNYTAGFHVGASVNVNLTDYFGVRGEVIYGQKGAEYNFSGDAFFPFYNEDLSNVVFGAGERNSILSITNTYLEIPLSAFIRFGRLELSGGMSFAYLVSSSLTGEVTFSGATERGSVIDPVIVVVDGSFLNASGFNPDNAGEVTLRTINGQPFLVPEQIGAYYENPNVDRPLFNRFDAMVQAGAAFYLNQGLFISFKGYYGLTDITRNEEDYVVSILGNDQELIFSEDDDRNFTLQASVGFFF